MPASFSSLFKYIFFLFHLLENLQVCKCIILLHHPKPLYSVQEFLNDSFQFYDLLSNLALGCMANRKYNVRLSVTFCRNSLQARKYNLLNTSFPQLQGAPDTRLPGTGAVFLLHRSWIFFSVQLWQWWVGILLFL